MPEIGFHRCRRIKADNKNPAIERISSADERSDRGGSADLGCQIIFELIDRSGHSQQAGKASIPVPNRGPQVSLLNLVIPADRSNFRNGLGNGAANDTAHQKGL